MLGRYSTLPDKDWLKPLLRAFRTHRWAYQDFLRLKSKLTLSVALGGQH